MPSWRTLAYRPREFTRWQCTTQAEHSSAPLSAIASESRSVAFRRGMPPLSSRLGTQPGLRGDTSRRQPFRADSSSANLLTEVETCLVFVTQGCGGRDDQSNGQTRCSEPNRKECKNHRESSKQQGCHHKNRSVPKALPQRSVPFSPTPVPNPNNRTQRVLFPALRPKPVSCSTSPLKLRQCDATSLSLLRLLSSLFESNDSVQQLAHGRQRPDGLRDRHGHSPKNF
jgi:hypothetical protein